MAKTRQHRTNAKVSTMALSDPASQTSTTARRPPTRTSTPGGRRFDWSRWASPITIAVLVLVGLITWSVTWSTEGDTNTAGSVQPVTILDSPDFHSLLVDPQDSEHVLFGSHEGIQESRDGGVTWEDGELRNADAMQLSASPKAPETLYATGHDVFQVSRDGGQTWRPVTHDLPGTDIHGFAQNPEDPQRLFAFVTGEGVFTSADGGTSWDLLPAQPPGGGMHVVLGAGGNSLYAATGTGLMVSRDAGQSWEALPSQPGGQIISLAVRASDPQTLYAGTPSGLAKSMNGGESWTSLGPEGVPILAIAVTPGDPNRIFLLSDEGAVYRSVDGGATWR
ncbi:MAG TPA: hypothetical protein VGW38_06730 [Chloroflexota bacterium]|nr:hypothetical protein [Chloroflexota bacterium]